MILYPVEISQTSVGSIWAFNTLKITSGIIKQIYVKAVNTDTTFNIYITDEKGNNIYDDSVDGKASTYTLNKLLDLPVRGICTIGAKNISNDELFTGRIMVEEW